VRVLVAFFLSKYLFIYLFCLHQKKRRLSLRFAEDKEEKRWLAVFISSQGNNAI
jgi:hypothetical protein